MDSICCHVTNKSHNNVNYVHFLQLYKQSKRQLLLDADYDEQVHQFCTSSGKKTLVQNYKYVRNKRHLLLYEKANHWKQVLEEDLKKSAQEREQGSRFRICIPSASKKQAINFHSLALKCGVQKERIIVISANTKSDDIKKFTNVNEYLEPFDIIIYTSKMGLGTSITFPVDRMFIYNKMSRGLSAEILLQMMMRARNLMDPCVHILVNSTKFGHLVSYQEARIKLEQAMEMHRTQHKNIKRKQITPYQRQYHEMMNNGLSDAFLDIYIHYIMNQHSDAFARLCILARRHDIQLIKAKDIGIKNDTLIHIDTIPIISENEFNAIIPLEYIEMDEKTTYSQYLWKMMDAMQDNIIQKKRGPNEIDLLDIVKIHRWFNIT